MALVNFTIAFKATCANAVDYAAVKARIDALDLTTIGQNVTMQTQPDNDPSGFVVSVALIGQNTTPS